jgi:hypothetical protein
MIAPPVLPQSAFCALKKTDWPKLDRFKFFILDVLNARRVSAELQLEGQLGPMGLFGIEHIIFDRLWERVGMYVHGTMYMVCTSSGINVYVHRSDMYVHVYNFIYTF